jgi:hypothetical protein
MPIFSAGAAAIIQPAYFCDCSKMKNFFNPIFLAFLFLLSCQPKADYVIIKNPGKDFQLIVNDSIRGAVSIEELSSYYYAALRGQISFEQFSRFIPDSGDIAKIYAETGTPVSSQNLKSNADTILQTLQLGFVEARSKAATLHSSWNEVAFDEVMVIDIANQKLPSKKIVVIGTKDKTTLRASAKCLQIGRRWFIGEDIRYGI